VTSLCAPPTVWRMMIKEDLAQWQPPLRELVGAGEPLNPEVIEQVERAWGIRIRDGFGQSETTCQIGNPPGQPVKPGSMGRPLPGYRVALLDIDDQPAQEGEIALDLAPAPLGLMLCYENDGAKTADVMRGGHSHTGDTARVDEDGYYFYVGRNDDVFRSSDYRISPFELESVLIEHPDVLDAAIVPAPTRCASPCRRPLSRCVPGWNRRANWPPPSSPSRATGWRLTSVSAASRSRNSRRRSPARSGASSCARRKRRGIVRSPSSGKTSQVRGTQLDPAPERTTR